MRLGAVAAGHCLSGERSLLSGVCWRHALWSHPQHPLPAASRSQAGTGLAPATSAPGLGLSPPTSARDWARPCHICIRICIRTRLNAATSDSTAEPVDSPSGPHGRTFRPASNGGLFQQLHLRNLGFASVINPCEDFYKVIADGRVPLHDVLVTNPP